MIVQTSMGLIKKYIDKFFEGKRDVAIPFTLVFGVLGIGLVICLTGILVCIFGGEE